MVAMTTVCLLLALNPLSRETPKVGDDESWREPRRCGTNTLHAFLNLHGRRVPLEAIESRVTIGPDGASMAAGGTGRVRPVPPARSPR